MGNKYNMKGFFMTLLAFAAADVDCSDDACQARCECAKTNCASEIADCLVDASCATGQACAKSCACGDDACSLKCVAQNPSPKAVPVGNCIKSNCESEVTV